jgi:hypothetical protein
MGKPPVMVISKDIGGFVDKGKSLYIFGSTFSAKNQ